MNSRPFTPYYQSTLHAPVPRTSSKGLRRGGTAASISEKNLVGHRKPASSHKFTPSSGTPYMTAVPAPHKLSLKGAGWSSQQGRPCNPLKVFAPDEDHQTPRPPTRYRTAAASLESAGVEGLGTPPRRPQSGQPQYEVPVLVAREVGGQRRIFSAHRGAAKVKPLEPPKAGRVPSFCSSLDQEFLALFN